MAYSKPAATASSGPIPRIVVAGLVIVFSTIAVSSGYQLLTPSSSTDASRFDVSRRTTPPAPSTSSSALGRNVPRTVPALPRNHGGALGEADGSVPDGTTVFDTEVQGVAKLERALLAALRRAAAAAAGDGIKLYVGSGWRSPAYQELLLREAISKYGSRREAARWVATPKTSAHVSGEAVDIGPTDARAWLSRRGAKYGLCQIYRNEPWHFELRLAAIDHGCPRRYADPTKDPRMQE